MRGFSVFLKIKFSGRPIELDKMNGITQSYCDSNVEKEKSLRNHITKKDDEIGVDAVIVKHWDNRSC